MMNFELIYVPYLLWSVQNITSLFLLFIFIIFYPIVLS